MNHDNYLDAFRRFTGHPTRREYLNLWARCVIAGLVVAAPVFGILVWYRWH